MAKRLSVILEDARRWFASLRDAEWLDERSLASLDAVERGSPDELFREPSARPLVVAFFGGTGVGKSSLLNRIAGAALARTGVERPTSHEVTLFVHEAVPLADLPRDLPVDSVRILRHASDAFRYVAWLDMPDIDSVAETNRATALAWLPYIDLICYVVSPERYRDDRGWRVLLDRRQRHGWLFVMNRWDEGHTEQAADFARLLAEAGFERPTLARTCCRTRERGGEPALPSPDEFERVIATVRGLAASSTSQLSLAAELARVRDVRRLVCDAQARLGDEVAWQRVGAAVRQRWGDSAPTIAAGLEYSIRAAAGQFERRDGLSWRATVGDLLGARPNQPSGAAARDAGQPPAKADLAPTLWDAWADAKLSACFDAVEVDAARIGVSTRPLRRSLDAAPENAARVVHANMSDALRAALAAPGTALARAARRATGFLMTFLPFLALLWISVAVVRGFFVAVHQGQAFLGLAFAINSGLLLAVSWGVPYAIDRLLRPSLRDVAERALRDGLKRGLAAACGVLCDAMDSTALAAQAHAATATQLIRACDDRLATPLAPEAAAMVARVA